MQLPSTFPSPSKHRGGCGRADQAGRQGGANGCTCSRASIQTGAGKSRAADWGLRGRAAGQAGWKTAFLTTTRGVRCSHRCLLKSRESAVGRDGTGQVSGDWPEDTRMHQDAEAVTGRVQWRLRGSDLHERCRSRRSDGALSRPPRVGERRANEACRLKIESLDELRPAQMQRIGLRLAKYRAAFPHI